MFPINSITQKTSLCTFILRNFSALPFSSWRHYRNIPSQDLPSPTRQEYPTENVFRKCFQFYETYFRKLFQFYETYFKNYFNNITAARIRKQASQDQAKNLKFYKLIHPYKRYCDNILITGCTCWRKITMKNITINQFTKRTGIKFTLNHTGKMAGMASLSTSVSCNVYCTLRSKTRN